MTTKKHSVLLETNLPGVKLFSRGKVRDVYELGDKLLVVATDRISAFDVVMREGIPDKGRVLTQLSCFWFKLIQGEFAHHFISANVADYPAELQPFADQLEGRSMLVEKAKPFPIECVVRGYLVGSGWKEYRASGSVCGIKLPPGLREASRLESPFSRPQPRRRWATMRTSRGKARWNASEMTPPEKLRDLSLKLYRKGRQYARGPRHHHCRYQI